MEGGFKEPVSQSVLDQTYDGTQHVRAYNNDEPLFLHNSDHRGMTQVTTA